MIIPRASIVVVKRKSLPLLKIEIQQPSPQNGDYRFYKNLLEK
jgi:hypothetical protein